MVKSKKSISLNQRTGKATVYRSGSKGLFTTPLKTFNTLADANIFAFGKPKKKRK
jgi:hypothetical protein